MNQQTKTSNEQKSGDSTTSTNHGPWTQPPRKINIEDLSKEITEVKNKKNEYIRKEKELLQAFKIYSDQYGLEEFEDGEENRFVLGGITIEKRHSKKWTYSEEVEQTLEILKDIQKKEQQPGPDGKTIAKLSYRISWLFKEAEE